jgi:predicted NAD/FAD-dependent oxidoreductase
LAGTSLPTPIHLAAHRWRYALVETPLGAPFLHDAARGLGACGDWCLGPRIESAWLSGVALGRALLT